MNTSENYMQSAVRTFSFAEIVSGERASVKVTHDGLFYAVDLVMAVSGKERNSAARDLRDIPNELFESTKIVKRQLSSGHETKLVSFENGIDLIMVLPGTTAKKIRGKFAKIIKRYIAGDKTLVSEIESNATSTDPIAQLARASLAADAPVEDTQELVRKRKRDDLELAKLELDVQERTEIVKAKSLANRATELANLNAMTTSYGVLCQDTVMDERARMMFKDNYLNISMMKVGLIGCAPTTGGQANTPISVSMVAADMGLTKLTRPELISAGAAIASRYKDAHNGDAPSKHAQICAGKSTLVNTYFECDRALLEDVLRERHCAAPAKPAPRPQRNILHHFSPASRN
jgi:hypothetical protein